MATITDTIIENINRSSMVPVPRVFESIIENASPFGAHHTTRYDDFDSAQQADAHALWLDFSQVGRDIGNAIHSYAHGKK